MVSASSDVSIIRHIVSRVRERGVGIAGAGAQSPFSFSLQSEQLAQEEIPAELDADRHLFRVELISFNKQLKSQDASSTSQERIVTPTPWGLALDLRLSRRLSEVLQFCTHGKATSHTYYRN